MGELFRQVIGVHVFIGRDKDFLSTAGFDERQVPAPFVFHPYRVEVFRSRAENNHNFGAVERRKNVRLVLLPKLILQRDAREKDLKALLCELVVKVVRQNAVRRSSAACVGFLVADEYVERRFPLRDGEDAPLNVVDRPGFRLVQITLRVVAIREGGLIVGIVKDRGKLRAVDRRDALARRRVLHILDAVPAQDERPMRFRVGVVLVQDLLV